MSAKLYFKYGCMGSSKSAQALITKFNYEELGMKVWIIKPAIDTRDGKNIIKSRIGLKSEVQIIESNESIIDLFLSSEMKINVIIVDESQFLTPEQVDELRSITIAFDIPVIAYGLRTDFQTKLFPGSQRLLEVADKIEEIKTMCECGKKAIVNARINETGNVIVEGEQIQLGANNLYVPMCYSCYKKKINKIKFPDM